MARMRTIAPSAFVEFKRWMADKAPEREQAKRRRDQLQSDVVQELINQKLLAP
jgi:Nucleotidyltransferase